MMSLRGWSARLLLVGCVLTVGLLLAGGASALGNGDPCSPFWTEETAPTAVMTTPSPASTFDVVTFDGSHSTQGTADKWTFVSVSGTCEATSTEDDPIATYTWTFGDGSTEIDSVPTTGHIYARPGPYVVTLTVTEKNCESGPHAHCFSNQTVGFVDVADRPPNSMFAAPSSVTTGRLASFDASASADIDGLVTGYHWDFGDGQSQDTSGPMTSHAYSRSGPKTVTLTVTDDSGSTGQSQQTVSVIDRPPSAAFTGPVAVGKGQAATFNASASSDPDGTITGYRWDFGDGQTQSSTTPLTTHTYSQRGTKTVTLTVIDDSGNSDHIQQTVNVTSGLPSAAFSAPGATVIGRPITFDASASSDPNGTITGYRWDFGDGQTQTTTGPTVSHAYHTSGTMTVTLTIDDDNGASAAARRTINVLAHGCVVPRLLGSRLGAARQALKAAGCRLGAVRRKHAGARRRRRVIRQSIPAGATRPMGSAVALTVGK